MSSDGLIDPYDYRKSMLRYAPVVLRQMVYEATGLPESSQFMVGVAYYASDEMMCCRQYQWYLAGLPLDRLTAWWWSDGSLVPRGVVFQLESHQRTEKHGYRVGARSTGQNRGTVVRAG